MKYLILTALLLASCSKYSVGYEQKKYIQEECRKANQLVGIDTYTCIGRASREVYYRNLSNTMQVSDRIAASAPQ